MEKTQQEAVWKNVLDVLKVSVSGATFNTWLTNTHIASLKEIADRAVIEIGCNSIFIKQQVESRYYGLIQDSLAKTLDKPVDISFIVKQRAQEKGMGETPSPLFDSPKVNINEIERATRNARLRQGFTFENFAVSGSNQLAHAAAEAVAGNPGNTYNPLFIWGGVGVGKTHLMHAVAHSMIFKDTSYKILACTAEDFTNDIIEGIRNKSTSEVRKKYRRLDALLIDDIQFIAGKDTAQEEFFHTFNAVTSAGGQIILTSDQPPSEISKLEERLRSRFEAGLIVDISPPDFELRSAIVQIKAEERNIKLDNEVVALIAGNIDSARKIQGFIVNLFTQVNLKGAELTIDYVQQLLGKGEVERDTIKASPTDVINAISKHYNLGKRDLMGKSRARVVARPRQVLMYLLKTQLNLPFEEVGRIVGGRDHTTVMHAVEKIQQLASIDGDIREDIRGIKKTV